MRPVCRLVEWLAARDIPRSGTCERFGLLSRRERRHVHHLYSCVSISDRYLYALLCGQCRNAWLQAANGTGTSSSLMWDITKSRLAVTDVSGHYFVSIFKSPSSPKKITDCQRFRITYRYHLKVFCSPRGTWIARHLKQHCIKSQNNK